MISSLVFGGPEFDIPTLVLVGRAPLGAAGAVGACWWIEVETGRGLGAGAATGACTGTGTGTTGAGAATGAGGGAATTTSSLSDPPEDESSSSINIDSMLFPPMMLIIYSRAVCVYR